jgi:serine/threonine-protein kinase
MNEGDDDARTDPAARREATQELTPPEDPSTAAPTGLTGLARPAKASAPIVPGERYQLGATIGRGGMGEIVAARDAQIGRDVAIKRLHPERTTPQTLARFLREARVQGRLEHPAIPPVHELGVDAQGRPFFAMKKLSGTTLSEIVRNTQLRAKFPRQHLLRAFADVCLAIELAHTRGVLHRDLKPSNVLLGDFGEVYVLDWGVAQVAGETEPEIPIPGFDPVSSDQITAERGEPATVVDPPRPSGGITTKYERTETLELTDGGGLQLTASDTTLGTPGYMAPEQITRDRELDGRADVYSLGCVLYEILTGIPLHPRGEDGLQSALHGVDARPSLRVDDVPPELDALCVRATATERDERIGSARELADAVLHFLDGDRDLALRRDLAEKHLAAAVVALSGDAAVRRRAPTSPPVPTDEEGRRRTAMREAGQALALDPTLLGAAELVGRLMLEPPRETPRAVAEELEMLDRSNAQRQARIGLAVHLGFVALAVVFYAFGAHDPVHLGALAALSAINAAIDWTGSRRVTQANTVATIVFNLLIIVLLARLFSPFLIAPGVGAVSLMAFASHPAAANTRLFAGIATIGIVGVLLVWFVELAGWATPTLSTVGGTIEMTSPIHGLATVPLLPALCLYSIVLVIAAAALAGSVASAERATKRQMHIQAWQLRQLLSVPARGGV